MARRTALVAAIARTQREAARQEAAQQRATLQALRERERARKAHERAQVLHEKERQRLYLESRQAEAEAQDQELKERVRRLQHLLDETLRVDDYFDIDALKQEFVLPAFDPQGLDVPEPSPVPEAYFPPKLSFFGGLMPGAKDRHARKTASARERYETDQQAHATREAERRRKLERARLVHTLHLETLRRENAAQHAEIEELKQQYAAGVPDAVVDYCTLVLQASDYPGDLPRHTKLAYVPESKQLVIEADLPTVDSVPDVEAYKYVRAKDEIASTPRSAIQRKALYASVIAQVTLRTLHEIYEADRLGHVDTLIFNGYVDAIDPGTGQAVRPCLITVRTTRDAFTRINLGKVEPAACLKTLNASVSRSPAELTPVRPVLEFSMVDPRFVQETDVLTTLDQRPNLMELTPSEFESLITNLFEKMGLETRLTQASRDGGVDCVAYDPRPIFGGKVVIQAKRYKHTVGVSAVRDLFGTVQNEGASKGILVTTSGYGKAAFDFAAGKPLELLSGSHLLYLLQEHAGIGAKIEVPETWRDPTVDTPEE